MTTNEKRENVFEKRKYSSTNRRKERAKRERATEKEKKKKLVDFGMVTLVE
jgi:hypothetical protein